ncbi:Nicotinamidase-related amidase [Myroides marinus]|uniref:Nicotinamidase-related amidase n=1 Tax=Myroides marinus TaxID=703342 RepID=A0A1H6Y884_9FLAO|nr:cysteine hydrolase [Myroides marinus]SEJ33412.1 Nicotinamidase-related amidase [Myroides marinus]
MNTLIAQTKNKIALVLIETQNEWMHPEGKLNKALIKDQSMMKNSISNIEKVLQFARKNKLTIIHVGLKFTEGYPELGNATSGLRKAIPNAGTFQENSFGATFFESVKPLKNEFITSGRTGASGFTGTNLDSYLRNNNINKLYIVGYATHVCVESTFRDAHEKGYNSIVISDATSAFNNQQQDYFLSEIVHHFGEHITSENFFSLDLTN